MTTTTTKMTTTTMNEQDIYDVCRKSLDEKVIFNSPCPVLYVDGTACSRKTSCLMQTRRLVEKIQRNTPCVDPDTYGPSMLGYICNGIVSQYNDKRPRFNDRSPLNPLEWSLLWKLMDEYQTRFADRHHRYHGYLYELMTTTTPLKQKKDEKEKKEGEEEEKEEERIFMNNNQQHHQQKREFEELRDFIQKFDRLFLALADSYYYRHFRDQINALAFVDSNLDRCIDMHRSRGKGSDDERGQWPAFYTALQNRMYRILYPGACLDMNEFGDASISTVVSVVAVFLNSLLDKMIEQFSSSFSFSSSSSSSSSSSTAVDNGDENRAMFRNFFQYGIPIRFKPPTFHTNPTLTNVTSHVYRTSLRGLARYYADLPVVDDCDPDVTESFINDIIASPSSTLSSPPPPPPSSSLPSMSLPSFPKNNNNKRKNEEEEENRCDDEYDNRCYGDFPPRQRSVTEYGPFSTGIIPRYIDVFNNRNKRIARAKYDDPATAAASSTVTTASSTSVGDAAAYTTVVVIDGGVSGGDDPSTIIDDYTDDDDYKAQSSICFGTREIEED